MNLIWLTCGMAAVFVLALAALRLYNAGFTAATNRATWQSESERKLQRQLAEAHKHYDQWAAAIKPITPRAPDMAYDSQANSVAPVVYGDDMRPAPDNFGPVKHSCKCYGCKVRDSWRGAALDKDDTQRNAESQAWPVVPVDNG